MKKILEFLRATLIGGLAVIVPIYLLYFVFTWLFDRIREMINPVKEFIFPGLKISELLKDGIAIASVIIVCFLIGMIVKTRVGNYLHNFIEKKILARIPGYHIIKDTFASFTNPKGSPFSSVALVRLFETPTLMTAFVTEHHDDGTFTVFVPSGLNPTGGWVYHLQSDQVFKVDATVEDTMRSLLSCGAGSSKLLKSYHEKYGKFKKEKISTTEKEPLKAEIRTESRTNKK